MVAHIMFQKDVKSISLSTGLVFIKAGLAFQKDVKSISLSTLNSPPIS